MHLHEYQSKELLKQAGIPTCEGFLASTLEQVQQILETQNWSSCVLKAQIHSGARGKALAVRLAHSPPEAIELAKQMLGQCFVTEQTGPKGKVAEKLLICPLIAIEREFYLAITYDRALAKACLIAASDGGMQVEQTFQQSSLQAPDSCKIALPASAQLYGYHKWQIALALKIQEPLRAALFDLLDRLVKLFFTHDATLVEINPLALTQEQALVALDAKIAIDDHALYRQRALSELEDPSQIDPMELKAKKASLAYVAMEGSIGCMVNGAGLAMATLDLLQLHGLQAANFLDVGGGADQARITKGFELLTSDPKVEVIFIHIFGGIMDCRLIIDGLLQAQDKCHVPVVLRMEGNQVDEAKAKLQASSKTLNFTFAQDLQQAAQACKKALELRSKGGAHGHLAP